MADNEIDVIIDAIATVYENATGLPNLHVYRTVPGSINAPALVFNLERANYDDTMGPNDGCDYVLTGTFFTQFITDAGQTQLRGYLSARGESSAKVALEANQTLDGLVDFAIVDYAGQIGKVNYAQGDFYSAPIHIKVATSE